MLSYEIKTPTKLHVMYFKGKDRRLTKFMYTERGTISTRFRVFNLSSNNHKTPKALFLFPRSWSYSNCDCYRPRSFSLSAPRWIRQKYLNYAAWELILIDVTDILRKKKKYFYPYNVGNAFDVPGAHGFKGHFESNYFVLMYFRIRS